MSRILALDTSTAICSAALDDNGRRWAEQYAEPRRHTELLLPMVDRLLVQAGLRVDQLDAIAFGCGPGSFTGLRIALGIGQGLAFACGLPMLPISSLASMAQRAADAGGASHYCCALDARMGEVYWGEYRLGEDGLVSLVGEEQVLAPEAIRPPGGTAWLGLGSGWTVSGMPVPPQLDVAIEPVAESMLGLAQRAWLAGDAIAAEQAAPVYLRNRVAIPISER